MTNHDTLFLTRFVLTAGAVALKGLLLSGVHDLVAPTYKAIYKLLHALFQVLPVLSFPSLVGLFRCSCLFGTRCKAALRDAVGMCT